MVEGEGKKRRKLGEASRVGGLDRPILLPNPVGAQVVVTDGCVIAWS